MGLRFRRTVKIAPGVRLNISRSGVSLTVGKQGLTTTIGKDGIYQNVGLPGTGLSYRQKVADLPGVKAGASSASRSTGSSSRGTSSRELAAIERERHRAEVAAYVDQYNAENDALVRLHLFAPPVLDQSNFASQFPAPAESHDEPASGPAPYPAPRPTEALVRKQLLAEGSHGAGSTFEERVADRLDLETQLWELARAEYERQARENAPQVEALSEDADGLKEALELALAGDEEYIETAAEQWISSLELPFALSAQFEYDELGRRLMVDLDLPEVEDLPTQYATQLKGGDLRMRDKTQKSLRAEYAQLVFGLAVLVSANLLNLSPAIEQVVVSGYTQRRDSAGELVDDYVFSVKVPREALLGADYQAMDPERFCLDLESRCNLSATKVFRAIEPYA